MSTMQKPGQWRTWRAPPHTHCEVLTSAEKGCGFLSHTQPAVEKKCAKGMSWAVLENPHHCQRGGEVASGGEGWGTWPEGAAGAPAAAVTSGDCDNSRCPVSGQCSGPRRKLLSLSPHSLTLLPSTEKLTFCELAVETCRWLVGSCSSVRKQGKEGWVWSQETGTWQVAHSAFLPGPHLPARPPWAVSCGFRWDGSDLSLDGTSQGIPSLCPQVKYASYGFRTQCVLLS